MKPDLTTLYSELGLRPNCSLEEFQLAYRRRISELQPNRLAVDSQTPESAFLLRDLIGLYTTASRFHRRYGRLPGAAPHRLKTPPPQRTRFSHGYAYDPGASGGRSASRFALVLAIALLILLFALLALASGEWLR